MRDVEKRGKKDTKLEEEGGKIQETDELKRKKGRRRENRNKQQQRVENYFEFQGLNLLRHVCSNNLMRFHIHIHYNDRIQPSAPICDEK